MRFDLENPNHLKERQKQTRSDNIFFYPRTHTGAPGARPARRLVEERLDEIDRSVAEAERELAEAERALLALDEQQTEAQWTASTLEHFADVWKVMTPGNRIRLVQALVRCIEVNEPSQEIRVVLHDLEFEHGEDEHAEADTVQATEAHA